jgi:alpha-galactosidase
LFYPPELMGCHIGPETCHLTGRQHDLTFRAGVAFWGHLGIEMDITTLSDHDRATMVLLIELYKNHRQLLHSGQPQRLDRPKEEMGWGVVSMAQEEGLFGHAQLMSALRPFPVRYRFQGLDKSAHYRVQCIWPPIDSEFLNDHVASLQEQKLSGDVLMQLGIALPIRKPESVLIYYLSKA